MVKTSPSHWPANPGWAATAARSWFDGIDREHRQLSPRRGDNAERRRRKVRGFLLWHTSPMATPREYPKAVWVAFDGKCHEFVFVREGDAEEFCAEFPEADMHVAHYVLAPSSAQ